MLGLCLVLGILCGGWEVPPRSDDLPSTDMFEHHDFDASLDAAVTDIMTTERWQTCEVTPPPDLRAVFNSTATDHPGVSACYLAKQTWCESRWDPDAVSPAGAIGISQFLPSTAADLGVDPHDVRESVRGQAEYILWLRSQWTPPPWAGRTNRDVVMLGTFAYDWGLGNVLKSQKKHGWALAEDALAYMPTETQRYWQCIERGHR